MQLSVPLRAALARRGAAAAGAAAASAPAGYRCLSSEGSSREGPSTEGQAPMPDFRGGPATADPGVMKEASTPGPRVAQQPMDTTGPETGSGLASPDPPVGIENRDMGPGDYSMPQIREDAYAAGGNAGGKGGTGASEEAEARRGKLVEADGGAGGSEQPLPGAGGRPAEDSAARAAAGPAGGTVPPSQAKASGPDLPPGHDASGATLGSTADQADAPAVAAVAALALLLAGTAQAQTTSQWTGWGGSGNNNQRNAVISSAVSASIALKSTFPTEADVSCTPTVLDGFLYVGDWAGYLYKFNVATGAQEWKVFINTVLGDLGTLRPTNNNNAAFTLVTRTSPVHATHATAGPVVVIGIQVKNGPLPTKGSMAWVAAVRVGDGSLVWRSDVSDGSPYAVVTASVSVAAGSVFVGVSSLEELAALSTECCTFRGSVKRLDLATGALMWTFFTVPPNGGRTDSWSGAAVWGSAPAVDLARGVIYIATGNAYEVPEAVERCISGNAGNPLAQKACVDVAGNWDESIVAVKITDGSLAWGRRMTYYDIWTLSCYVPGTPNACPFPESPDYDFGQAPLFLQGVRCPAGPRDLLVAAQKSGQAYALDPAGPNAAGERLVWSLYTGVGSDTGGSQWGSAFDGMRTVFLQNSNFKGANDTLINPAPGGPKWTTAGFATAVDVCTGKITWQAASPIPASLMGAPTYAGVGTLAGSGYVFYPTLSAAGHIVAFKAETGALYSIFSTGSGSVVSGPFIVNDVLYVGSGYARFAIGVGGKNVYAFDLKQQQA
ncbi:hypothetical protein HYH03_007477 [Edaphochlamys debaryana]|uniref:Pyrrolo-quinoline quinone repeat domain-containing protein n=1 Tax=Edaphochlamys debaryana TaxID=47281 RepID=A0A836BZ88_9CHLO|nr:hypothetical protein HYH03_007477 [Edaphochlamys debaryana]|eukprot:KAG2494425.1 hypothetical protein HYH03_007477 [Edaphochlamys debaryana]